MTQMTQILKLAEFLSRPVSPKLAHEAVLAKPPYFDDTSSIRSVQNEALGCPKWGKREVRRQESGDRMGQNTVKDILQDGCPE